MGHGTRIAALACLAAAALFALLASANAAQPAISAGGSHSVALHVDGTVSDWGSDRFGQLGLGRTTQYASPVQIPGIAQVRAVAAGSAHVLAVNNNGTVLAWGLNDSGQLGDGTFQPHSSPTVVPGLENIVAVAAGDSFSLALAEDGTVWSWGNNFTEQLGHPPKTSQNTPGRIPALSGIVAISAGHLHALALAKDGSVWVWGGNDRGQLGNLTIGAGPWKVTGITDAKAVAAGYASSLIVRGDGTVWGAGAGSGLCTGNYNDALSFVPTLLSGVTALASSGFGVTLAIQASGTVLACGSNTYDQLGLGPQVFASASPQAIGGLNGVVAVCVGEYHSMALRSDGRVFTWGSNQNGELGNPSAPGGTEPYPVSIAIDDASALACGPPSNTEAGTGFSLVVRKDGSLWMFGNNLDGIAGDAAVQRTSPGRVAGLDQVVAISAGNSMTLAVRADGTVWNVGQRGQIPGNVSTGTQPTQVPGISGAIAVSVGGTRSLALRGDGTVYSWGGPLLGGVVITDLGLVPGLTGIVAIAAGTDHLVALRSDGTVLAWGRNQYGAVGDGTTTDRATPVTVTGVSDVIAISAGAEYTLALKRDGTVWGWGINGLNQVSTDGSLSHPTPVPIANLSDVKAISAGPTTPLALKSDGTIWTWGYTPGGGVVRTAGSLVADAISQGAGFALAMKRDGTVWAWGGNFDGELGNGTLVTSQTPTVVIAEDGAGSIEGNDWFLDLDPSVPSVVAAEYVPAFLMVTTGEPANAVAHVQYRAKDVGKSGSVYVFALTPTASPARTKDGACQLAQLGPNGQLVPVAPGDLQAAITGILSAQGQLVTILNNGSASQYPNSTFFVGYGTTSSDMFDNGTARGVVTLGDGSTCTLPSGFATVAYPGPLSGLWWNSGESGWGIDFTQRRDVIFAAWYTYDTTGNSKWYVASACTMPAPGMTSGACSGTLYEVTGPVFFGAAFDPKAVKVVPAGSLNVNFASASKASMTYTLGTQSRTVDIERQVFASGATAGVDYTDLWWNPNESGWGIAVSEQASVMFLTWFVYDDGGEPTWYVASDCAVSGQGCSGTLYRTTGPAFGGTFDSTSVHVSTVGSVSLAFTDPNNGTLTYTVNGATGTKSITRQLF